MFILGRMENLLKDGAKKTKVLWVMLGVPNSSVFASFSEHLALIAPFPLSFYFMISKNQMHNRDKEKLYSIR